MEMRRAAAWAGAALALAAWRGAVSAAGALAAGALLLAAVAAVAWGLGARPVDTAIGASRVSTPPSRVSSAGGTPRHVDTPLPTKGAPPTSALYDPVKGSWRLSFNAEKGEFAAPLSARSVSSSSAAMTDTPPTSPEETKQTAAGREGEKRFPFRPNVHELD